MSVNSDNPESHKGVEEQENPDSQNSSNILVDVISA